MCGICFVGTSDKLSTQFGDGADELLCHRGPDATSQCSITLPQDLHGVMQGCVLHLRGTLTPQPVTDTVGNALLWNGEIFGGLKVSKTENDTQVLFNTLVRSSTEEEILDTLHSVQGPWAFIFWQAEANKLWFGRDVFGRRSLLWHLPACSKGDFILTSVALGDKKFTEIPSVGIFCLDFSQTVSQASSDQGWSQILHVYVWPNCVWPGTSELVSHTPSEFLSENICAGQTCPFPIVLERSEVLSSWIPKINPEVPVSLEESLKFSHSMMKEQSGTLQQALEDSGKDRDLDSLSAKLIEALQEAVTKRVCDIPQKPGGCQCDSTVEETNGIKTHAEQCDNCGARVSILFSGGLDSTVLAALADRCLPPDEPIDLLNVAFQQAIPDAPPQKSKHKTGRKTQKTKQTASSGATPENSYTPCQKEDQNSPAESFSNHLKGEPCCNNDEQNGHKITCAGDSFDTATVNATATVSFPSPHKTSHTASCDPSETGSKATASVDPFDVPDRLTGRVALAELNPSRQWNFVEINVTQKELKDVRESRIRRLIYPLQTVLDDSIGCAVWFAARGLGILANSGGAPYHSKARVVLCGMAADEQFAGYSRHRVTFEKSGWPGLVAELSNEMWRISARNLGRDDRIITDHGKESRFPFLDENVTQLISTIPVHQRANLHLPRGLGEKLLLRIAALKLGLPNTACQPKRAIQFGSKIAKLDNKKEKGSDSCSRLS